MDPHSTSKNMLLVDHKGSKIVFEPSHYLIFDACGSIVLIGKIVNNIYMLDRGMKD